MRRTAGRTVAVNGRSIYVEESGRGAGWVVFEAGSGEGRASWDAVVPRLADEARLVAYDRAGFGRSGPADELLGIDDLAADLVGLVETVVPKQARVVLVAHSMGGLVSRRAAASLGPRLAGLLLVDPTPERSPVYDTFDRTVRIVDRWLAVGQVLVRFRPMARLSTGRLRRAFPPDTYATMLAENFTPAGLAQTRKELKAVAAAIHRFRADPPAPPECPTILLSASRPSRRGGHQPLISEHQRRWAETLRDGRFELVDSAHLIQAEQPEIVADRVRRLLARAGENSLASPGPPGPAWPE